MRLNKRRMKCNCVGAKCLIKSICISSGPGAELRVLLMAAVNSSIVIGQL